MRPCSRDPGGGPRLHGIQSALDQLDRTATLPVDDARGRLYAECKRIGHALHAKDHTGDRWIAAAAIHLDVPLLAADGIYRNVPGLRLLDDA